MWCLLSVGTTPRAATKTDGLGFWDFVRLTVPSRQFLVEGFFPSLVKKGGYSLQQYSGIFETNDKVPISLRDMLKLTSTAEYSRWYARYEC